MAFEVPSGPVGCSEYGKVARAALLDRRKSRCCHEGLEVSITILDKLRTESNADGVLLWLD